MLHSLGLVATGRSSLALCSLPALQALTVAPDVVRDLALGENDEKVAGDRRAGRRAATPTRSRVLQALPTARCRPSASRCCWIKDGKATDVVDRQRRDAGAGEPRRRRPQQPRAPRAATRDRRAQADRRPTATSRLAAAKELQSGADEAMLPRSRRRSRKETDAEIKSLLELTQATIQLTSSDKDARLAAIRALAESSDPNTKTLLLRAAREEGRRLRRARRRRARRGASSRCARSKAGSRLGETIGRVFTGMSASAASCCWPRSASPSPTA